MKRSLFVNVATALFVAMIFGSYATARTLDVYVLTGQSNSMGTVQNSVLTNAPPIGNAPAEQNNLSGQPNVPFWFDNFHGYNDSTDTALGASTAWGNPIIQPKGPYNYPFWGPEMGFSRRLFDLGARDFAVVKASRDGGGNTLWQRSPTRPPDGTTSAQGVAYWKVVDTLQAATTPAHLAALGYDDYKIVGLMYLQGESNSAAEATDAAARFTQLLADLKSDFPAKADNITAVIGENLSTASNRIYGTSGWQGTAGDLSPSGVSNTNLHALVTANPTTMGWVQTSDMTIVNTDGLKIHADANSQMIIGQRYADDFVALGTANVPEPGIIGIAGVGALGLLRRRRSVRQTTIQPLP